MDRWGKTGLDNTLLLCSAHHRRMHEGGFRIKPNHAGEWYFETAAGKHLLTLGRHPVAEARLGYAPSLTLLPQSVVTNDIRKGAKPNGAVFVPRAA